MNAKELIEAATRLQKRGVGGMATIEDLNATVDHVLSTVRPDDNEPVTREQIEADGWFRRSVRYRHWESQISVIEKSGEFIAEFENGQ
jgi:hypothetical protein